MAKKNVRRRRSAAEWARLISTWERSGQSAAAFARQRGLSPKTFTWWRWRLSRESPTPGKRSQGARTGSPRRSRKNDSTGATPSLVAVEVQPEPVEQVAEADAAWELESNRGVVLRVRTSIPEASLKRIVAAMTQEEPTP